jgi:aldose 1-epimerase
MLTLQAGDSSLVLAPEIGGAIVGWSLGAIPLLRRASGDAIVPGDVHGMGCFPLVPFSNRIAWGRFRWQGGDYTIERNFGDHPHAIHGIGWQSRWTVAAASRNSATLVLAHGAEAEAARRWPFAFEAEQSFTLLPDRLRVSLAITNRHASSAPCGLGLHPYFPRSAGSTLQFAATQVWINDADMLPSQCGPISAEWDHTHGLQIGRARLDNCFAGWNGQALITAADGRPGLRIEADDVFGHLIVFTPDSGDYFCAEPVSHMTDAINRFDQQPGHGLRSLAPGETLRGEVTFRLTASG